MSVYPSAAHEAALDAIHAAALDPRLWQAAMDAISVASGGVKVHMMHANSGSAIGNRSVISGYDPDFIRDWDGYYEGINAWAPGFIDQPLGVPVYCEVMCPYPELARTEFYADWVAPQEDIIGGGGIVLARTAAETTLFGGNIPRKARDQLDANWQRDLALFGRPIRQAIETNTALAGVSLDLLLTRSGLAAAEAEAAVVTDQGGRIMFCNAAGERALVAGGLLKVGSGGRLATTLPAAALALAEALSPRTAAAPAILPLPGTGMVLRILRLSEATATALRLPPSLPGARATAVVTLAVAPPPQDETGDLARRLGLSRAETEIALALAQGRSTDEIASLRGVSVLTLRNQIKTARSKTGARRQSDLVLKVERARRDASAS